MASTSNVEEVASTIDKESLEAQKLLQLASAQRMNTDVRRAIFCVIMSGEDYVDAFEKLLRLDLQGKQVSLILCATFILTSGMIYLLSFCCLHCLFLFVYRIGRSCGFLQSAVYRRKYLTSITLFWLPSYVAMTESSKPLYRYYIPYLA